MAASQVGKGLRENRWPVLSFSAFLWNGQHPPLGDAGRADWAGALKHGDGAGDDRQRGIADARGRVVAVAENDGGLVCWRKRGSPLSPSRRTDSRAGDSLSASPFPPRHPERSVSACVIAALISRHAPGSFESAARSSGSLLPLRFSCRGPTVRHWRGGVGDVREAHAALGEVLPGPRHHLLRDEQSLHLLVEVRVRVNPHDLVQS